ncbi:MAG: hypothetical protein IIV78_06620 [Oscillospiraceae bacterium]|nr:hypothetical protein [Oscillospiraceae bacterium]
MKRLETDEYKRLVEVFISDIAPWCKENGLSLHEAFEISRELMPERYNVLSTLWATSFGKAYLRSYFKRKPSP